MKSEHFHPEAAPPSWDQRRLWTSVATYRWDDGALTEEEDGADGFVGITETVSARRMLPGNGPEDHTDVRTAREIMIDCTRGKPCVSSMARLVLLQGQHGQGPYDSWALDNIRVTASGGISTDSQIICRTPPSPIFN
eukprot:848758-Rhodomonas_salina.4